MKDLGARQGIPKKVAPAQVTVRTPIVEITSDWFTRGSPA